jgi:Flp pilus assembly protein TadB
MAKPSRFEEFLAATENRGVPAFIAGADDAESRRMVVRITLLGLVVAGVVQRATDSFLYAVIALVFMWIAVGLLWRHAIKRRTARPFEHD